MMETVLRNGVEVRGVSSGCALAGAAFDFNSGEAFGPDGEFLHLHVYLGVGGDFRFICSGAALTVDELHEAEVPHTHKADPDDPKSADVPCRPEGVQFVVYGGDCLVWLDLDDVRNPDTGEVEGWAEQIVNDLGGYWEVSASGCGLHGCVRGKLPRTENHQVKDDPLERTGRAKQPYCFEVNDGELFAFAGIWDQWKDRGSKIVETCSILTTGPNAVTSVVHDRMPVILEPDAYDLWLDPAMKNVQPVSELLKPYDARRMRCYPVSTRINHVANDDRECSMPLQLVHDQESLFS